MVGSQEVQAQGKGWENLLSSCQQWTYWIWRNSVIVRQTDWVIIHTHLSLWGLIVICYEQWLYEALNFNIQLHHLTSINCVGADLLETVMAQRINNSNLKYGGLSPNGWFHIHFQCRARYFPKTCMAAGTICHPSIHIYISVLKCQSTAECYVLWLDN